MKFKGDISVYVFIMLGMVIGMYLMGFSSVVLSSLTLAQDASISEVLNTLSEGIVGAFTNYAFTLPMLIFGSLAGIAGKNYAAGTILSFIIPIMILFAVINIFVFPVVPTFEAEASTVTSGSPMGTISLLLSIIFNAMLFLAVIEWTSGRK